MTTTATTSLSPEECFAALSTPALREVVHTQRRRFRIDLPHWGSPFVTVGDLRSHVAKHWEHYEPLFAGAVALAERARAARAYMLMTLTMGAFEGMAVGRVLYARPAVSACAERPLNYADRRRGCTLASPTEYCCIHHPAYVCKGCPNGRTGDDCGPFPSWHEHDHDASVPMPDCFREATVVEVLGAGAAVRCSDGNTYVFGNIDRGGAFACPATGWILYTPPRPCRFKDGPGDAYIWPVAGRGRIPHEQFDRHYRALRAADHTESILNAEPFAPPPSHSLADRCLRVLTSAVDRAADPQAMLTFPLPEAQLAVLATAIRLYAPPPKRGSKRVREQ